MIERSAIFALVYVATTLAGAADWCSAALLHNELLANGDAETGDTVGWTAGGGATILGTTGTGTVGVPGDESIGDWAFYGGTTTSSSSLQQSVDLSSIVPAIDAGQVAAQFHLLLQSRTDGATTDTVSATLSFLDGGGSPLTSASFNDPLIVVNVADWHEVDTAIGVPVGAREITLTLQFSRTTGDSTDAFADNASLVLVPEPAAMSLLALGGFMLTPRRRR